jgi:hypothetical protein
LLPFEREIGRMSPRINLERKRERLRRNHSRYPRMLASLVPCGLIIIGEPPEWTISSVLI